MEGRGPFFTFARVVTYTPQMYAQSTQLVERITICNLQFAIRTSKASRPRRTPGTALPVRKAARVQAVTCLAQLALPRQAGNTQGEVATALDLHSPAVTGLPSTQPPLHPKFPLSIKKKKSECRWRSGKTPVWL